MGKQKKKVQQVSTSISLSPDIICNSDEYVVYSERAKKILLDHFPDEEELLDFDIPTKIPTSKVIEKWYIIEFYSKKYDWLAGIWTHVQSKGSVVINKFKNMIKQNKITYELLHCMFFAGQKVKIEYNVDSTHIAAEIDCYEKETCYSYRRDNYIKWTLNYIQGDGHKLIYTEDSIRIDKFNGYRDLDSLPMTLLTDEDREKFSQLGKLTIPYLTGIHFVQAKGSGVQATKCGPVLKHFTGRCIIDESNDSQNQDDEPDKSRDILPEVISDCLEYLVVPYLGCYNIERKEWSKTHVQKLHEIEFRDDAFDRVVMDPKKKQFIKTVVSFGMKNNISGESQFQDIINNKSGGLIFLLKGSPGLGKTLIAESTAEFLHTPLISITAGELGYGSNIEYNLQKYIDLCKRWKAILLIDEADVFMEQRDNLNIERNSMVTVFLRMLERFDGILFLTTNRYANIDSAIKSRMTFQLEYQDFTADERKQVWENLLKGLESKIQLSQNDIIELANQPLNGREIKHAIKLSIAAQGDKPVLTLEDIKESISYL